MKNNSIWGGYFSKDSRILKGSVLVAIAAIFSICGFFVSHANATTDTPDSVFVDGVQQIANSSSSAAVADNTYEHGWKWIFYVTVPNTPPHNETLLKMKFADWINGSNIISAGGNMKFYSEQSTNAMSEANAIPITSSTTWSDVMNLNPNVDLNSLFDGRQIRIIVEAKIPTGSAGGSYSTSYDINTTATSSIISFSGLTQTYNSNPRSVTVTTDPAGIANTVTYTGIGDTTYATSTTAPTHAGTYNVVATITDSGYASSTSTAQLEIKPAPVTVTVYPETKVYGTTDPALTSTTTPPLFGDDSFNGALARISGENVGSYLIATGTLALNGDYELTVVPNYFTITPASATITLGNLEQTYDKIGKSVGVTTVPSGLNVDITYNGSSELPVNAGTYSVIATINDLNYSGSATATSTINQAPLTVTATPSTKVYDGNTSSSGVPTTTSGQLFGSDTATWTQTFYSKDVGVQKTLTATGTPLDGNSGNNYKITFIDVTSSITPATAVVSATGQNKVYNGTKAATTTLNVTGAVGGDVLTATDTAAFVSKDVADNIEVDVTGITLSGAPAGDYLFNTTASTTANITPAPLSITASSTTKTYGDALTFTGKEFTTDPSFLYDGDSITSVTLTSPGAASTSPVANYDIVASNATGTGLTNYNISYMKGILAVSKNSLTATITAPNKTYDGTASSTITNCTPVGIVNSDVITCTATNGTFSDKNVGIDKIVTADVSFTGDNVDNYSTTTSTTTTASITARALTVTATTTTKVYDGNTSSTGTPTTTPALISPDSATCSQTFDTKNVGANKALTAMCTISDGNGGKNYAVTYATTTGSITSATASVTASGTDKVYDGTTAAKVDLKVNGVIGTDDVTATGTATFDTKDFGTSKIVTVNDITLKGTDAGNYSLGSETSTTTTADITAKALTATITAPNKTYDGTASSTNITCAPVGVASGDSVQCAATNGTFSDKNVGPNKIVTAGVTFTGDVSNYSLATTATTTANITQFNLTAVITPHDKVYDGTTAASTTCSLTGVISPDQVTCTSVGTFNSKNATLYGDNFNVSATSSLTGPDAGNYILGNATATLQAKITQSLLTVTAVSDTKVYDGTTASTKTATTTGSIATGDIAPTWIQTFDSANAGSRILSPSHLVVNDGNLGSNYAYTYATTTGTITQASQTIKFLTYPTGEIDGNSFVVTATSTSGLPVSFSVVGASGVCAVDANTTGTIDVTGSGQCPVTIAQTGDTNYSPAKSVTMTFTVKFTVAPTLLTTTSIISNSSNIIGDLSGATLTTTGTSSCDGTNSGTSACYTLNVTNVQTSTGANLPEENDGFTLTSSSGDLTSYFAGKGWSQTYIDQINSEISGSKPFFYFVSDGHGTYSLADGFQWGLGAENKSLVIDDSYPAGIYVFTGNVNGKPVTVTLTVVRAPITFLGPRVGPPYMALTTTPTTITNDTSGIVATGTRSLPSGGDINFLDSQITLS